ncbi:Ectonucleotide pyrophosphatase/phosphodiesterase family member 6 [Nymphon striatum]|nr:Ectonucleotide pyrophosphatase/phosphodiesterase family member 6 [Nymphon striatum]
MAHLGKIAFIYVCTAVLFNQYHCENSPLLVILLDGTRWDYIHRFSLNGWKKLRSLGTVAEYMLPVFPADSYPNWNSITTGIQRLYPESHEHPFNYLYNQEKGDFFLQHPHPNVSHSHWWQAAEPIWITAEKYYRKTAVFGWGGCEVQINNSRPWYCDQYINRNPEEELLYFKTSVNKAIDLLTNKKIDFALVYNQLLDMQGSPDFLGLSFGSPGHNSRKSCTYQSNVLSTINILLNNINNMNFDINPSQRFHLMAERNYRPCTSQYSCIQDPDLDAGIVLLLPDQTWMIWRFSILSIFSHKYGANSLELDEALVLMDEQISNLMTQIEKTNVINTIILSDHGMSQTTENSVNFINTEQYISKDDVFKVLGHGSTQGIYLKPAKTEKVYQTIKQNIQEGLSVYNQNDIPESYHIRNSKLLPQIILVAHPGYYISPLCNDLQLPVPCEPTLNGTHGYDPAIFPDMRTIFTAVGPGIAIYRYTQIMYENECFHLNFICHSIKKLIVRRLLILIKFKFCSCYRALTKSTSCACTNYLITDQDTVIKEIDTPVNENLINCEISAHKACTGLCKLTFKKMYNEGGLFKYFKKGRTIGSVLCERLQKKKINSKKVGMFVKTCDKPMLYSGLAYPNRLCCRGIEHYMCPAQYFKEALITTFARSRNPYLKPYNVAFRSIER